MPHILVLEENKQGKDYLCGDIHGNSVALNTALEALPLHSADRFFIVGDLFDRGIDPVAVFHLIMNKKLYSVRGNHEDLLLKACSLDATAHDIFDFLYNGGFWTLQDNTEEKILLQMYVDEQKERMRHSEFPSINDEFSIDILSLFQSANKIPELSQILQYVENLPYIIRVAPESSDGFIVCHSDLPFSDSELDMKESLTKKDIAHITWARGEQGHSPVPKNILYTVGKRDRASTIVYCGHTIITLEEFGIRYASSHINLDVGAYVHYCLLVVCHTDRVASLIPVWDYITNLRRAAVEHYQGIAALITDYLYAKIVAPKYKECIQNAIARSRDTLEKVQHMVTNHLLKISIQDQNLVKALMALMDKYPDWINRCNQADLLYAKEATSGADTMINQSLLAHQGCCFFKQPTDILSLNLVTIQNDLIEIDTDLNKLLVRTTHPFMSMNTSIG